MQKIEIVSYFNIGAFLEVLIGQAQQAKTDLTISKDEIEIINEHLQDVEEKLRIVGMEHTLELTRHAKDDLGKGNKTTWKEALALFECIQVSARSELSKIFVGFISADDSRYWNQERFFGDLVFDNFESARSDIKSAANCHAVREYTACVFHLMRVVEKGLRALAKERGIRTLRNAPLAWADWNTIIRAIEKKVDFISTKWSKGPRKDKAIEFYRGAVGELYSFKDAYRNYVTHDRATYDRGQSISAIHRVQEFMERLAVKLSEKQKGAIVWAKK